MGVVVGQITARNSGAGVANALVTAFAVEDGAGGAQRPKRRLGSVATNSSGSFEIRHDQVARDPSGTRTPWRLLVMVAAPDTAEEREMVLATVEREDASELETVRVVVPDEHLDSVGLRAGGRSPQPEELIASERLVSELRASLEAETNSRFAAEMESSLAAREAAAKPFAEFLDQLSGVPPERRAARAHGYLPPGADIVEANLRSIQTALSGPMAEARSATCAVVEDKDVEDLKSRFGGLEEIPADALEQLVWKWKRNDPIRLINLRPSQLACKGPPDDDCVTLLEQGLGVDELAAAGASTNGSPAGTSSNGNGSGGPSSPTTLETPDVPALVHHQVDTATSPEVLVELQPRARLGDVQETINGFVLESGPADAPALFDFEHLQIAFEPLWHELFDAGAIDKAEQLYESFVQRGVDPNPYLVLSEPGDLIATLGPGSGSKPGGGLGVDVGFKKLGEAAKKADDKSKPRINSSARAFLISDAEWGALQPDQQVELSALADIVNGKSVADTPAVQDAQNDLQSAQAVQQAVDLVVQGGADALVANAQAGYDSAVAAAVAVARQQGERLIEYAQTRVEAASNFDHMHKLIDELDKSMKEIYRFNVYAASRWARSVNFGIVVTYRQRWEPVTYQVGELVKTIPLAPKESRRFTKKLVTKQSRSQKEAQNNLESRKTEASETSRAESEIVQKARNKTNFDLSAEGGVSIAIAHASAKTGLALEAERDSQETKKEFREAVFKAAEEYKAERTLTVESSDSFELTAEESGEISNPNDEIPVTYLFYQLQRRFRVSEQFRSVVPVVLVAQEFPKPNEINDEWIVAHDWVLRRVLLDDSFLPALTYLSTRLVGDEASLEFQFKHVTDQQKIVWALQDQIVTATKEVAGRYNALEQAMAQRAAAIAAQDDDGGGFMGPGLFGEGLVKSASDFLSGSDGGNTPEAAQVREDAARDAYERVEKKNRELQERLDRETTVLQTATDTYTKQLSEHLNRKTQIARLRVHIKENVFYYMQAVWSHEVPDQRYFRLHDVQVPRLKGTKTYKLEPDPDAIPLPPDWKKPYKIELKSKFDTSNISYDSLGDIADLDSPLGFKGNYMIFPLTQGNDLTDFMTLPYYDPFSQASDPDPLGNWTLHDLVEYTCCERKMLTKDAFDKKLPGLIEAYRILKERAADDEELIVPTNSLYIEALPGAHPVLEDFKLFHRAIDVKKAQAEVRGAELENVRFAARLLSGEREDPTIEKKIVIEGDVDGIVTPEP